MKKIILGLFFIISIQSPVIAQTWQWCAGTTTQKGFSKITSDRSKCTYIKPQNLSPLVADTIFKIDSLGGMVWQLIPPVQVRVKMLVTTGFSDFYMAGNISDSVTYGGVAFIPQPTTLWFARYDANGTLLWIKSIACAGEGYIADMSISNTNIILTGMLSDTAQIGSQIIPKAAHKDLFVAKFDLAGNLIKIKCAADTSGQSTYIGSTGEECETDAAGNIYITCLASGKAKLDTFSLCSPAEWVGIEPGTQRRIIKFDPLLNIQYNTIIGTCYYFCHYYSGLQVNSAGECYYTDTYIYNQSGNNDYFTTVRKLNSSGQIIQSYRPKQQLSVAVINEIEIDQCDNLYFTGFWRYRCLWEPCIHGFMTGQLSSNLELLWFKEDSTLDNRVEGKNIAVLGVNDLLIAGLYSDTLNLTSPIYNTAGFFARIQAPSDGRCMNLAKIPVNTEDLSEIRFYPNPSSDLIHADHIAGAELVVYDHLGKIVLQQKLTSDNIDVSALQEGLYLVIINKNSGSYRSKIIVSGKSE